VFAGGGGDCNCIQPVPHIRMRGWIGGYVGVQLGGWSRCCLETGLLVQPQCLPHDTTTTTTTTQHHSVCLAPTCAPPPPPRPGPACMTGLWRPWSSSARRCWQQCGSSNSSSTNSGRQSTGSVCCSSPHATRSSSRMSRQQIRSSRNLASSNGSSSRRAVLAQVSALGSV
jgi:hypothetical protein